MEGDRKALLIAGIAHCLETMRHAVGITVFTALTALGAAGDGIPGHLGPFDGRLGCHAYFVKICLAIFTAVDAPFGFPAAKQSR
jgi:hypothetical protein